MACTNNEQLQPGNASGIYGPAPSNSAGYSNSVGAGSSSNEASGSAIMRQEGSLGGIGPR